MSVRISWLRNATDGVLSPFDAFLVLRGLKTHPLRIIAHCESALRIATFLEAHPRVEGVLYPGLPSHPDFDLASRPMAMPGGMVTFLLKGDWRRAAAFSSTSRSSPWPTAWGASRAWPSTRPS